MAKVIDILILGATGYTGRLITRYLELHPQRKEFNMALAGRSTKKLDALIQELNLGHVAVYPLDISNDEELEALVKQAKVVINCVGPFYFHSKPIVRACERHHTHYTDITGEPHFIYDIIQDYDYAARKKNTLIIPAAGMDSVPLDYAVYLSIRAGKRAFGPKTTFGASRTGIWMPGSASGGTLATILGIMESTTMAKMKTVLKPYALSPIQGLAPPPQKLFYTLPFTSWVGGYSIMGGINKPIVQRTWGLHEHYVKSIGYSSSPTVSADDVPYAGPNFVYDEFAQSRNSGFIGGTLWSIGFLGFLAACAFISPFRWLVGKLGPQPGSGPSERSLSNNVVELMNVTAIESSTPKSVKTAVNFKGSAYLVTAVTASEIALAILLDFHKLPKIGQEGGILTSASALGDVLVERLEKTGRFSYHSEIIEDGETRKRV